jgi:hypothetical protein
MDKNDIKYAIWKPTAAICGCAGQIISKNPIFDPQTFSNYFPQQMKRHPNIWSLFTGIILTPVPFRKCRT